MRRFLITTTVAVLFSSVACNRNTVADPLQYVDPLIATCSTLDANFWGEMPETPHANAGCTPGVLTPFGMVNLGPVTKHSNYTSSGYDAHDTTVTGFSFMRMSGTGWCAEFGNLLTTATTGPLKTAFGSVR